MPPLPVPPQPQGLQCATFKSPPLDGSLSLPELCDWHGQNSPDHTFFAYAKDDGSVKEILWSEGSQAIRRATRLVRQHIEWEGSQDSIPVIAILSSSDAIPFVTTILGMIRANCAAFPISPRNSPAAVAHLLDKIGPRHILVGREQAMQDLVAQSLDILRSQYGMESEIKLSPMLTYSDLYLSGEATTVEDVPYTRQSSDIPALIMHSSGTTAFPKPIHITLHRLLQIARAPCYGECDLAGKLLSLHTSPMYHAMGVYLTTFAITSGMRIGLPAPKEPVPLLTADAAMRGIMAVQPDYIVAVPSMVEAWSRNLDYVEWLTRCRGVLFGGGPLDKDVGDYLASCSVRLCIEYGSTECGPLSMFLRADITGADWQYFKYARHPNVHLEPAGSNQYEAIILASDLLNPCVHNRNVDGVDGFATSDVLEEHPSKKGFFRIIGRADDQIMHSTGEKTNPGPLEGIMKKDPRVAASVMFGRGRFQAGILVEPRAEFAFDPVDEVALAEFRNEIWPTVQKMNAYAPQHSRLFKEMILVAKPTKPFTFTEKHNVRRGAVLTDYEDEINSLYAAVDASTQVDTPYPMQWSIHEATEFVRSCIDEIMTTKVPDEDDLFQHGCDSLQATYIRNALLRVISTSSGANVREIPEDFVYVNRTISRLGVFVSAVILGGETGFSVPPTSETRIEAMRAMVLKHTAEFPTFRPEEAHQSGKDAGDVVLVTGTTGSLGCHLLAQLVSRTEVRRVYAFNRPSKDGTALRRRQEAELLVQGLSAQVLDSDRVVLLEGDLAQPMFGLPENVYSEMHHSVTHIVHNAWPIDFALKLASFEPQIQGVRALVNFALTAPMRSSPPQIQFISSVGVFQNVPPETHCFEKPAEPIGVATTGYAESKWVAEEILYRAAAQTPILPLVVRLGQVCGGPEGAWNSHEWFPSMVQSAHVLGCFPDDARAVDWIPVDFAAAAILDFRRYSGPAHIVHLRHPRPVSWRLIAASLSEEFSLPLVPYPEWFAKLEDYNSQTGLRLAAVTLSDGTPRSLNALRLMPFYRSIVARVNSGPNALGMVNLDLKEALQASSTLGSPELKQLQIQDARRWLMYWRKMGTFW